MDAFADYAALAPLRVAVDVETAAFDAQAFQKGIVAHPVGDQRAHPGNPLRAVVVGAGDAYRLGYRIPQVADAGVLQPAAGFGVAEKVVGVSQGFAQQYAVGARAAGADQKGRYVLQRQRAAHYRLQPVADADVLVIAGLAAPRLFVQHLLVDGLQLGGGVFVAAGDGGVFAPFAGRPALVTGAPAHNPRHQFIALVGVDGFYVLDYQRFGIAALAFPAHPAPAPRN